MVVLSILVLLECLDDLEGLLQLGIKGRVAQTQWPSRVRVPPVTPVAFTPACPGPVGTGPGRVGHLSFPLSLRSTPPAWPFNRPSAPSTRYPPANKPLISIYSQT